MREYKTKDFMKHSKTLHVFKSKTAGHESEHTHQFIEIVYVASGSATHTINGSSYTLNHGDIVFMNYGCTHSFVADKDNTYVNILFSPDVLGDNIITPANAFSLLWLTAFNDMRNDSDFGRISFFGQERARVEGIIGEMVTEYRNKESGWETVAGNNLGTLLILMLRKNQKGIGADTPDTVWRELSEYIDSHFEQRLTLSSLAEKCFYNPSYFSRVFKEKFGMSLKEYITRKRLDCAIELLLTTDLPIEKISEISGFADRGACSHAFSKYLGSNPKDYRKR